MPDGIMGIVDTSWHSLVTDIDRISARLRDGGQVGYFAGRATVLHRLHLTGCTSPEGVLLIDIDAVVKGETQRVCPLPIVRSLRFDIEAAFAWIVIIHDHLMSLPVTFPWGEHYGSGLFKHGNQIGYDDGLCE